MENRLSAFVQQYVSVYSLKMNDAAKRLLSYRKKSQSLSTENHRSSSCVLDDGYVNTANKLRSNAALMRKNVSFNLLEQTGEQCISGDDTFQFNRPSVLTLFVL